MNKHAAFAASVTKWSLLWHQPGDSQQMLNRARPSNADQSNARVVNAKVISLREGQLICTVLAG